MFGEWLEKSQPIHFAVDKIRGFAVGKACPGDKEL